MVAGLAKVGVVGSNPIARSIKINTLALKIVTAQAPGKQGVSTGA